MIYPQALYLLICSCILCTSKDIDNVENLQIFEGHDIVLTCVGKLFNPTESSLHWQVKNGKYRVQPSSCYYDTTLCVNHENNYSASATFIDVVYTTTLLVYNVSRNYLNTTFYCILYDGHIDRSFTIKSWFISEIISQPGQAAYNNDYTDTLKVLIIMILMLILMLYIILVVYNTTKHIRCPSTPRYDKIH